MRITPPSITIIIMCLSLISIASPIVAAQQGPDFENVQVETVPLRGGIYMLVATGGQPGVTEGGNLGVSTGEDGVFLVDDQFAPMTQKIQAAISKVTDKPVRFVFNTHWHGDHAGGNENLAKTGAVIVAHDQARQRMSTEQFVDLFQVTLPASPKAALPVVSFSDTATFHLNQQTIQAIKIPPAHTDGDVILHFKEADVIHTGDVYFNGIYPLIDVSGGGSFEGMLAAADRVLSMTSDTTQIIPGHGPLSNRKELLAYRNMLSVIGNRIKAAIAQGISLDDFLASKPTADYDPIWGQSFPTAEVFVSTAYKTLDPNQWGPQVDTQAESQVLASYPMGSFLENLEVQSDGRVLITNYPAKTIDQLSPHGEISTFAKLSAYPLDLLSIPGGYLVTANGKSLLLGEDATSSQQLLLLNDAGEQIGAFDAPDAMALNGMVALDDGTVLAADSLTGTIWKIDGKRKRVRSWLKHTSLTPLADQEIYKPGANGIKLSSDGLIVSNTSRGTLLRVQIKKNGKPSGPPEVIANVGMIDDFWIRDDDSILFTTHEASVKLLSTTGDISEVASQHLLGNTAVEPFPPGQTESYVATTDGGLYFGAKEPAKVVLFTVSRSPKEVSRSIATRFFTEVWNQPYRIETIDELMDEHFVITNSGHDIEGREDFKKWVQALGSQVSNLKVKIDEMVVTEDGERVVTRMVASGNNNGIFGTQPDGAPMSFTLISILEIRQGKITHNWVEKSAFELHKRLTADP